MAEPPEGGTTNSLPSGHLAQRLAHGQSCRAERFGHDLSEFPNVGRWREAVIARPAVKRGLSVKVAAAFQVDLKDPMVRAVLFNQRAR